MLSKLKSSKGNERKELLKELEAPAYRYRINKFQEAQRQLDSLMNNVYKQEKEINTLTYIDVAYNACQIGNIIIGSKYTDNTINPNIIVKQGYVKCSICVTGEKSCITSDLNI